MNLRRISAAHEWLNPENEIRAGVHIALIQCASATSSSVDRILAPEAVKYFDHPKAGADGKILFTNLVRLLESYRYNAFSDDIAPGILELLKTQNNAQRTDYGGNEQQKIA